MNTFTRRVVGRVHLVHRCSLSNGANGSEGGWKPPPPGESAKAFMDRKWNRTGELAGQTAWPTDRPLGETVDIPVELQPHWQSLERRVTGRKPRRDGPSGRSNMRKSEEDYWLEAGVYGEGAEEDNSGDLKVSSPTDAAAAAAAASGAGNAPSGEHEGGAQGAAASRSQTAAPAGLPPGAFVRHSTVAVHSPEAAAALAVDYAGRMAPACAALPGFLRATLLHDASAGTVHAITAWESAAAASAAADDATYGAGVARVAAHFAGPPAVAELTVLGDYFGAPFPVRAAVQGTEGGGGEDDGVQHAVVEAMSVRELRSALAARSLPTTGLKAQLQERLKGGR